MQYQGRVLMRLFFVFVLAGLIGLFASLILGSHYSLSATAQGPSQVEETPLTALAPSFEVIKQSSAISITAGDKITYTVVITNTGPDTANSVIFYDNYPSQMQDVVYDFSRPATITNLIPNPKPTYILTDVLPVDETLVVTISGILTSSVDITVTNIATVTSLVPEISESASVDVVITGTGQSFDPTAGRIIYVPLAYKPQPIILAYQETFDSGEPWIEGTIASGCQARHRSGQYWVEIDRSNRTCLPPAANTNKPSSPYVPYGEFEVAVYHSEGRSEAWLGLFTNGRGGDNYYLFRIQPNEGSCSFGGDWELLRRRRGDPGQFGQGGLPSGYCPRIRHQRYKCSQGYPHPGS